MALGARSKIARAEARPVDIAVPPPAVRRLSAAMASARDAADACTSETTTCAEESKATTKNHAPSGMMEMAVLTARRTASMRSPAMDPDLSTMNPTTRGPPAPAWTCASAVTVRMASTRPWPGGRNLFWKASSLKAMTPRFDSGGLGCQRWWWTRTVVLSCPPRTSAWLTRRRATSAGEASGPAARTSDATSSAFE